MLQIHLLFTQEAMQALDPLLGVDKIYIVSKFRVIAAKPTYKPFPGQLMIEFSEYSSIHQAQDPPNTFPSIVYNLTPFNKIIPSNGPVVIYTGRCTGFTILIYRFSLQY